LDWLQKDGNVEREVTQLIKGWQTDAEGFFREALGIRSMTTQQRQGANALSRMVESKMKRWFGEILTDEEKLMANLEGISIMSGKGTGKDAFLAWAVLWFLCCFENSKIPLTGPSRDQMKDVLLAEIAKWANRKENGEYCFLFHDDIVIQSDKIYMKDPDNPNEEGKSWWARLRTVPKNADQKVQAKNMDGLHEDYMMIGVDEADGVPQPVLTSLETTITGPVNFILLIFNPTKSYGYAWETHYDSRAQYWHKIHWDSRDSENVDQEKVKKTLEIYGEDAPEYRVNVLGLPPEQSEDTLIPQSWIDLAKDREYETDKSTLRIMGLDPARQGGDPAGVIIRDGKKIIDFLEFAKLDTNELVDEAAAIFIDWECDLMFVDMIGNGAGVYDNLKIRFPGKVRGVDVSRKPTEAPVQSTTSGIRPNRKKKRFNRLRDELYWKVRTTFENGTISYPSKHRLARKFVKECMVMKREPMDDDAGVIKIEGKAKMKSRGVKSPNLLEAYMVSLAARDGAFKVLEDTKTEVRKDPWDEAFDEQQDEHILDQSWQAA
jgi:phage terminase large subunit